MNAKILLLNPDLTYGTPPQMLQGLSGRTYAMSRWHAVYHCHAVEMSLEEFEKSWQDLQRAVHLPLRRWFPRFVVPQRPSAVVEFEAGYEQGREGKDLAATASFAARAGWKVARGEQRGRTATLEDAEQERGRKEDVLESAAGASSDLDGVGQTTRASGKSRPSSPRATAPKSSATPKPQPGKVGTAMEPIDA